jgi:hypothetical protein
MLRLGLTVSCVVANNPRPHSLEALTSLSKHSKPSRTATSNRHLSSSIESHGLCRFIRCFTVGACCKRHSSLNNGRLECAPASGAESRPVVWQLSHMIETASSSTTNSISSLHYIIVTSISHRLARLDSPTSKLLLLLP